VILAIAAVIGSLGAAAKGWLEARTAREQAEVARVEAETKALDASRAEADAEEWREEFKEYIEATLRAGCNP